MLLNSVLGCEVKSAADSTNHNNNVGKPVPSTAFSEIMNRSNLFHLCHVNIYIVQRDEIIWPRSAL